MKISTLSRACAMLSASLILSACSSNQESISTQVAPGSESLPILSADEAANFTSKSYLAFGGSSLQVQKQGWFPVLAKVDGVTTDYVVGPQKGTDGATYTSVQQAVNALLRVRNHGERIFIKVLPGTYQGAVYIPAGAPPITLFGVADSAQQTVLQLGLEAAVSPADYRAALSPNGELIAGDRAWYMFNICASQNSDSIGVGCSATVWSQSSELQIQNLTIANSLQDSADAGDRPAVALQIDGDQTLLENVRLIGRQNTLFVNTSDIQGKAVNNRYNRAYIRNSLIEGDVDYVFGRANVVFDRVEFHTLSSRGVEQASVFAPNTAADVPYGFLVINSSLTSDRGFAEKSTKPWVGHAWDQSAEQGTYVPGQTSNGQLVIRDSQIDSNYNLLQPWGNAAFSARPFSGNIALDRNLNDVNFNRLWQYNNVINKSTANSDEVINSDNADKAAADKDVKEADNAQQ